MQSTPLPTTVHSQSDSSQERPLGLTLLSAGIATVIVVPLLWIVLIAADVELSRAQSLLFRARNLEIIATSLALVGVVTIATILIGVPMAYLTTRTTLPYRRLLTILIALPLVVPSYLGAFALLSATGPNGLIERELGIAGVPEISGFVGAVTIISLYTYPYVFLTTRAGLQTFDDQMIDAARMLSATRWRAFTEVIWPHIRPAVSAGALLAALYAIADFGTPAFMGVNVFTRAIYAEWDTLGWEYAALLSLQLMAIALVIVALESAISRQDTVRPSIGGGTPARPHELGHWRWPAAIGCSILPLLALAGPITVFLAWIGVGTPTAVPGLDFQWQFVINSVSVSLGAALIAAVAAIPIAYLAVRHASLISWIIERSTYIGFAIPGIVIGLALVFLGTGVLGGAFYQTLPLLVFAYLIRFFPQAVSTTKGSILHLDPRLLETARVFGRSRLSTFREVTLPLITPGIVAGAALVFLTAMRELPATLLLRPTGFDTLVIHIWEAHEAAYHGYAAIPALILIAVSAASMVVLLQYDRFNT